MRYSVSEAIDATEAGKLLIICDHPDRENEGDFFVAAEKVDVHHLNSMIQLGRGLVCCPMSLEIAVRLALHPQTAHNTSLHQTRFTVSVDSRYCVGSGVSVPDRVRTIRALADSRSTRDDFARPGHLFPITSHKDGLAKRGGHTEAAIALLELANLALVGVICEIINDAGEMARGEELEALANILDIGIISVEQVARYYLQAQG